MACKCEKYEKLAGFVIGLHNGFFEEMAKPSIGQGYKDELFYKRCVTQEILDYIDLLDKEEEYEN